MSIIIAKFRMSNKQMRLIKEHVRAYEPGTVSDRSFFSVTFYSNVNGMQDGFEVFVETHDEAVAKRFVHQLDVFFGVNASDEAPIHALNRLKGFDVSDNTRAAVAWVKEHKAS